MSRLNFVRVLILAAVLAPGSVFAQTGLLAGMGGEVGYGTECLSPNDDGSSALIDITPWFPSGLRFFDQTHTNMFVNTNGNVSFSNASPPRGVSTYTPNAFPVADQPMIAPYWADVDIRGNDGSCGGFGGSGACLNPVDNGVWWHGEPGRMVITWHKVGYYSCNKELVMNFQLIITAAETGCLGAGDFDVEFRYNQCQWETGDASMGMNGFGGTEGQAGFDAGNSRDFVEISGSRAPGIANHLCMDSNVGERGVWRFQIRRGMITCPDAGDECDTGLMGVCGAGLTACVGGGTECISVTEESGERCDAVDNDCDGNIDEGDDICSGAQICDRGACLDICFEGGCGEGQMCTEAGRCVDDGCEDLVCPAGQRCARGECVGACDGIVCPAGHSCNSGRCSDVCASITCDESCQVCADGECIPSCDFAPCATGDTCLTDGRCFETACVGVSCAEGEVCEGGSCRDACADAVCPGGEVCILGACQVMMSMEPDAGVVEDAGMDGAVADDAGQDAGPMGRRVEPDGCGCRVAGAQENGSQNTPLSVLVVLGLALFVRRRRG